MKDLLIFEVRENQYAISLEHIQRIIQVPDITNIPNAHKYIDGMMSYENRVIKVVNFRKMTGINTYEDDLKKLFNELKNQHTIWVETLKKCVEDSTDFHLTTDPHICELGKWIDEFTSYDTDVSAILKSLADVHKGLHVSAENILAIAKDDKQEALRVIQSDVLSKYNKTMHYIDQFIKKFGIVADSLQKLLLFNDEESEFALKVDAIVDIAHVDEEIIKQSESNHKVSTYLELEGVIELNGVLVNIIKSIKLPIKEVA